jgi:hypothetical protein
MYIGLFKVIQGISPVAYKVTLPTDLIGVHDMFHLSML